MARTNKPVEQVIKPEVVDAKPTTKAKTMNVSNGTTKLPTATLKSFEVIRRPLVTEKSMQKLEKLNKVTIEVLATANKTEVKLAFEAV